MKILIVGGFLGSGKTSILLQLAKYVVGDNPDKAVKVVFIENEIGDISLDDKVLSGSGYDVQNMFSGCVCCTMTGELVINIHNIRNEFDPELIILEASGVAIPKNIKETIIKSIPSIECVITCVTDAKRWMRLVRPMELLLNDQLGEANVIVINKIDAVDADTLDKVRSSIRTFNDTADIIEISAKENIDTKVFQMMLGDE